MIFNVMCDSIMDRFNISRAIIAKISEFTGIEFFDRFGNRVQIDSYAEIRSGLVRHHELKRLEKLIFEHLNELRVCFKVDKRRIDSNLSAAIWGLDNNQLIAAIGSPTYHLSPVLRYISLAILVYDDKVNTALTTARINEGIFAVITYILMDAIRYIGHHPGFKNFI